MNRTRAFVNRRGSTQGPMRIYETYVEGFGNPLYVLSNGSDDQSISAILNEAKHAFDWRKEGLWIFESKKGFASLLVPFIQNHPN